MKMFFQLSLFLCGVMSYHNLNFGNGCCGCCEVKDQNNLFFIDFTNGKYEGFIASSFVGECGICGSDEKDFVYFKCGFKDEEHRLCLSCFLRGFCTSAEFLSGDGAFLQCLFGDKAVDKALLSMKNIRILFLQSGVFRNRKDVALSQIKKILENKTGSVSIDNSSIEELKEKFKSLNKRGENPRFKPCPCCKMVIEKDEGCNAFRCKRCGCFFCWLCGWFSFAVPSLGHEHFGCCDCVQKGQNLLIGGEDLATYFGRKFLFENAKFEKPRFFKHERLVADIDYLAVASHITSGKYTIEDFMGLYDVNYDNVFFLVACDGEALGKRRGQHVTYKALP